MKTKLIFTATIAVIALLFIWILISNAQLTSQEPYRIIAKDWIDNNIRIQGLLIKENFELDI